MPAVDIHADPAQGRVTLSPVGEIDIVTAPDLRAALEQACAGDAAAVVVDFAAVTFADSTALSVLIAAHRILDAQARSMSIVNVAPTQMRVFTVTGLQGVLGAHAADQPAGT